MKVFTLTEPFSSLAPLVVDSPHSGCVYPPDFQPACPLPLLRQTEDFAVDQLIAGAVEAGATVLGAEFPRCYIDVNRAESDLDPAVLAEVWPGPLEPGERTLLGLGLVRRLCKSGVPVYREPLPLADVRNRIETFYRPYHAALEKAMAKRMGVFGECFLIDAHSMPDRSGDSRQTGRPDFVLGDRQGTSCDPAFTRRVRLLLQEMGFSVALNDPYKGMEIVRRHGNPHAGRHALQLEINRRLYMHEDRLELHDGFIRLQKAFTEFFRLLAAELVQERPGQMAAE